MYMYTVYTMYTNNLDSQNDIQTINQIRQEAAISLNALHAIVVFQTRTKRRNIVLRLASLHSDMNDSLELCHAPF